MDPAPSSPSQPWQLHDRFLEIRSRWITLIGEHLQDHQGEILEYWRVEKADSVIVLSIQGDRFLLPAPNYRPGVGQATLDFPGGRVAHNQTPPHAAIATLKRELGVTENTITQLYPLNTEGWAINSSFSNQKLYSFVALIHNSFNLPPERLINTYPTHSNGVRQLLQELTCLQCRTVLLEWLAQNINLQQE